MADEDTLVFDLDQVRAARLEANPPKYRKLKLYDREWDIREEPNMVALLEFSDAGGERGQLGFLLGYIRESQREDFKRELENDEALDADMLSELISYLTKQDTGRPTQPSTDSDSGS